MLKKIPFFILFVFVFNCCFAEDKKLVQTVTSEVFFDGSTEQTKKSITKTDELKLANVDSVPAWPLPGTDVDVFVECGTKECQEQKVIDIKEDNNADNLSWTGGANMLHGMVLPAGFDDECYNGAEMPLLRREMLEADGGNVLAVSRSSNKKCSSRAGGKVFATVVEKNAEYIADDIGVEYVEDGSKMDSVIDVEQNGGGVVKSWVVMSGQSLRDILQEWCDVEGWDLAWNTSREYPVEAGAVFKGRFVDVASALVRNFGRANPVPYATFYKGNRVLVISTKNE